MSEHPHVARGRQARSRRRRAGRSVAVLGAVLVAALAGSGRAAAQGPTGATGATGPADRAPTVACLDARLRPADACPGVELGVTLALDGDALVVTATNDGDAAWAGGPVAVELPLPEAPFGEPSGAVDPTGAAGDAEWVTRAGAVVGRCVFEPVTELAAGASLQCRLARTGLADGEHRLWFTGFVGGLPVPSAELDDATPAVGVVPVATARSVRFRLADDDVRVIGADRSGTEAGDPSAAEDDDDDGLSSALPIAGLAVVAVGAGVVVWARRRRSEA